MGCDISVEGATTESGASVAWELFLLTEESWAELDAQSRNSTETADCAATKRWTENPNKSAKCVSFPQRFLERSNARKVEAPIHATIIAIEHSLIAIEHSLIAI